MLNGTAGGFGGSSGHTNRKGKTMRKADVKIGGLYAAKVSGQMHAVRILSVSPYGGWNAVNTCTKRNVRIKSAGRLRYEVTEGDAPHPDSEDWPYASIPPPNFQR